MGDLKGRFSGCEYIDLQLASEGRVPVMPVRAKTTVKKKNDKNNRSPKTKSSGR
jgi:hypothetical protein